MAKRLYRFFVALRWRFLMKKAPIDGCYIWVARWPKIYNPYTRIQVTDAEYQKYKDMFE